MRRLDLQLDLRLAEGYKSPSQRARRLTEGWFAENMYCAACPNDRLERTRGSTEVVDFLCPKCGAEYQVKAKVFEAYAQHRTPGAYRVFWCYGPGPGEITILAITPHP